MRGTMDVHFANFCWDVSQPVGARAYNEDALNRVFDLALAVALSSLDHTKLTTSGGTLGPASYHSMLAQVIWNSDRAQKCPT